MIRHLLGLGLGEFGAEDLGSVVFEALDFGLHVSYAGLFGGKVGFVWLRYFYWGFDGSFDGDLGLGFGGAGGGCGGARH